VLVASPEKENDMTRQLFIPPLGKELTLAADWQFNLHFEDRNRTMLAALKIQWPRGKNDSQIWEGELRDRPAKATLPAGTLLTVRRLYIRLGQKAFDSVTFSAKVGKKSHRFWVKLADANKIVFAEDEIEHLLASPVNAAHLERSTAEREKARIEQNQSTALLVDSMISAAGGN
jgi:hypothetical protein